MLPPEHEPELIREFFGGAKGFFADIGANDPQKGSQTWHLEQAGWTGILVEPQPDLADTLKQVRSAKVYAVACSSPEHAGGTMPLYAAGPFSSFDPKLAVAGVRAERVIQVPVRTLDDLLIDAKAPKPIDFLSIDVEGHEIEVLRGFDFERWQPRLILLEDHVTGRAKHRFMRQAGYSFIRRTGLNSWYVPRQMAVPLGWWGKWQFVRKYYLGLPFRILRDFYRRIVDQFGSRPANPPD